MVWERAGRGVGGWVGPGVVEQGGAVVQECMRWWRGCARGGAVVVRWPGSEVAWVGQWSAG